MPKIGVVVEKDGKLKTEYANIPDSHYRLVQRYGMTFRGEVYGEEGAIFGKCRLDKVEDEVIEVFVNEVKPKGEEASPLDALCRTIEQLAVRESQMNLKSVMRGAREE